MLSKYRILILAIAASFVWHVLWLSVIKVVAAPNSAQTVKFSKISFLGPILAKGSLEVRSEPQLRSILEKRYLSEVGQLPRRQLEELKISGLQYGMRAGPSGLQDDGKLAYAIDEAVAGQKMEPVD